LFSYVTSSRERMRGFTGPIVRLCTDPARRLQLLVVLLAIPALVAATVWTKMNVPLEAPGFGRTVHPAPPDTITVGESEIDLIAGRSPYAELKQSDPEAFADHLANGRRVYYQNCFYCHGDAMAGDGMYAHGLNPVPTNFTDQGILPMFQDTYIFWRVAKGAPGLPEEAGPWDSFMPAWDEFLTEEELWDAVHYLYDFNQYEPRANVTEH